MGACQSNPHCEAPLPDKPIAPLVHREARLLASARLILKRNHGVWNCDRCQFINPYDALSCVKCSKTRRVSLCEVLPLQKFFDDTADGDSVGDDSDAGESGSSDAEGEETKMISEEKEALERALNVSVVGEMIDFPPLITQTSLLASASASRSAESLRNILEQKSPHHPPPPKKSHTPKAAHSPKLKSSSGSNMTRSTSLPAFQDGYTCPTPLQLPSRGDVSPISKISPFDPKKIGELNGKHGRPKSPRAADVTEQKAGSPPLSSAASSLSSRRDSGSSGSGGGRSSDEITKASYRQFEADIERTLRETAAKEGKVRAKRVDGLRESIALPYAAHLGSKKSDKQFDYMEVIGRGGFGRVVRVKSKLDRQHYAMKITDKRLVASLEQQLKVKLANEVKMMNVLDHPFIVRLCFNFETKFFEFMCMEILRGGSLSEETLGGRKCAPENIRIWAAEIVLAVDYIHAKGLVYRDLKPDNVMMDESGHVRLIDLGLVTAVSENEKLTYVVGARGFKAPEMLKGAYGKEIDWFNLGVLLYRMFTGLHPFGDQATADARVKKYKNTDKIKFNERTFSREARDLIRKLLDPNPQTRITARKIKAHPYFDGIDWTKVRSKSYDIPKWQKKIKSFPKRERVPFKDARDVMKELQRQDEELEQKGVSPFH